MRTPAPRREDDSPEIRIWLVEDDNHYRQTLCFLLDNAAGMHCTGAFPDGESALSAAEAGAGESPDVVLLDIHLPGLSGLECLARLKAALPEAQVVMLTNDDDEQSIFDAFCTGASGYLLKNVSIDRLLTGLREAARGGMLMPAPVARKVLDFFGGRIPQQSDYGITQREQDILREMVEGRSQKEIARQLFISPSTVNGHIQHIYRKLHVNSSTAAVAKAVRERLV